MQEKAYLIYRRLHLYLLSTAMNGFPPSQKSAHSTIGGLFPTSAAYDLNLVNNFPENKDAVPLRYLLWLRALCLMQAP